MIITTSNILINSLPIVTTGISTDLPVNITNQDFSVFYTSSDNNTLIVEFGATSSINYVAVAGMNIQGNKNGTSYVRVYDGVTLLRTANISSNLAQIISFDSQAFTNLRIELFNAAGGNPILRYAAAGVALTLPNNGEQAGYNRHFLNRNFTNKTTTSNIAAPIALLRKRKQAKGALNLPNMTREFSETTWQEFLDFSEENHFFIREQDSVFVEATSGGSETGYLCYEVGNNKVTAHAQTRELNNISIQFKVFNGL